MGAPLSEGVRAAMRSYAKHAIVVAGSAAVKAWRFQKEPPEDCQILCRALCLNCEFQMV